jgi:hypothetical protein
MGPVVGLEEERLTETRIISQISSGVDAEGGITVLALADDGTLWEGCRVRQANKYEFRWYQLPSLPPRED